MKKLTCFLVFVLLSVAAYGKSLETKYLPNLPGNVGEAFFRAGQSGGATAPPSPVKVVSSLPLTCTAVGSSSSARPVIYQGRLYACTSTNTWTAFSTGSSSITINGLTNTSFTLAVGTSGTDFAVANAGSTVTFNLPDASTTARGLVVTGAQTFGGQKVFQAQSASDVPLVLQGTTSQSGDLLQFKNVSNVVLGRMDNTGSFVFNNGTVNAGIKFKDSGGNTILVHQLYGDDYYWDNTTASGSINIRTGGTNLRLTISSAGLFTYSAGANFAFATSTGTKIGTGSTQKFGFWNATPIAQPSSTGETAGFTAGAGTAVKDDSCFTGNVGPTCYRVSDLVKHLKNVGLVAQ